MLGAAQAALFGAAFAQQRPALVSLWAFDETSDAGGAFNDLGPASLAMDIVGTWADLATDSMVQGIGGTSAYTSGFGYATIPANHPAHELSALTISFYYQPNGAAAKHILFVAGNGSQAGDFSIELLTNGRLRGYHVGQDSTLRFFESTNGITGTNLQVGTAYRIDATFGPAGAKIYLDGVPLTDACIAANTNGWNNSRVKYLGTWVDGTTSPAEGAFDHLRIWGSQLSDAQIAALEDAQEVTLPEPPAATTLEVPDVGVWLPNDDMALPGTGTLRYVSPTGSGIGGTSEGAAGNLHSTLAACSAGDTVVCLQGYYSAPNGLTFPAGSSATNPVTIMAKPGAWAVLCQDTNFLNLGLVDAGAGEGSSKTWTLHDAATNTWRIPYSGGASLLNGVFFQGGMAHMLFPYPSLTALMSDRDSGGSKPQTRDQYWFSGLAVSGGFAYIRLDRPNWSDMVSSSGGTVDGTYGAWPDDGRYTVGIENGGSPTWFSRSNAGDFRTGRPIIGQGLNPNNLRIYIAAHGSARLLNQSSGNFTRLGSGMNSMGYTYYTTGKGSHEIHRGCHYIRGFFISTLDSNVSNITAHRARFFGTGEHRLQGSMAVMKYNSFLNPPDRMLEASHRNGFLNLPFNANNTATNLTFDNCTICYYHEIMVGDEPLNKVRFVNCTFHMVYDEFSQHQNEKLSQVEVGYCYMRDTGIFNGGGGETAPGTQSPFATEWYHHNIMDQRCPRSAWTNRRPSGGTSSIGRDIGAQAASKRYNNTIIFNPDDGPARSGAYGWCGNQEMVTAPTALAQYDEVFNNIIIRHDTKRYNGEEGAAPARTDAAEYGMLHKNSSGTINKCLRDYNLYYRDVPVDPSTGSLRNKKYEGVSGRYFTTLNFDYVRTNTGLEPGSVVFHGSVAQGESGVSGKRWEVNGSDANPQIPSVDSFPTDRMDYRPQNTGAVGASATPPSGANWWTSPGWTSYGATAVPFNMAPSPWKGALDPNGAAFPIGVQNP